MKIDTVNTLLQEEIKDIYDFEKRLTRAIPKMAKGANSEDLRSALMEHLEVTRGQVERIEQVFKLLETPAKAKPCAGMKGIIEEGDETLAQDGNPTMLDLAIIGAARRVEHYEMAAYLTAHSLAEQCDQPEIVDLLQKTLDEERQADETLSSLASEMLANVPEQEGEESESSAQAESSGRTTRKPAKKQPARVSRAQS
jgi:ferritin-like metal-binding protein YciE